MSLTISDVSDSFTSRLRADSKIRWYRRTVGLARSRKRFGTAPMQSSSGSPNVPARGRRGYYYH